MVIPSLDRKGGAYLSNKPLFEQKSETTLACTAVVGDNGQIPDTEQCYRCEQRKGHTHIAETAHEDGRTGRDARHRAFRARPDLADAVRSCSGGGHFAVLVTARTPAGCSRSTARACSGVATGRPNSCASFARRSTNWPLPSTSSPRR